MCSWRKHYQSIKLHLFFMGSNWYKFGFLCQKILTVKKEEEHTKKHYSVYASKTCTASSLTQDTQNICCILNGLLLN